MGTKLQVFRSQLHAMGAPEIRCPIAGSSWLQSLIRAYAPSARRNTLGVLTAMHRAEIGCGLLHRSTGIAHEEEID